MSAQKPAMGRPPLPPGQCREVVFVLRCTPAEKAHILARGGSNYVRAILAAAAQRGNL